MKLSGDGGRDSFYESFSDLIFATMAIFVLLMMVFLTLIRPEGEIDTERAKQLETEVARILEEQSKTKAELERSREQVKQLTETLYAAAPVTAKGLSLVVAVDTTGSMGEPLGHLIEALRTITVVLPRITTKFYIGIVAYRDTGNGEPLQVFPLRQIVNPAKDGGSSSDSIERFLNQLVAANGLAPVELAVDQAISMHQSLSDFDGYQSFMLLGDAGPYERSVNDMAYTSAKRAFEKPIINRIASWAKSNETRTVISLFSGNPDRNDINDATRTQLRQSLRFFNDIAKTANQPENFTRNPARILEYLLTAIVENE